MTTFVNSFGSKYTLATMTLLNSLSCCHEQQLIRVRLQRGRSLRFSHDGHNGAACKERFYVESMVRAFDARQRHHSPKKSVCDSFTIELKFDRSAADKRTSSGRHIHCANHCISLKLGIIFATITSTTHRTSHSNLYQRTIKATRII